MNQSKVYFRKKTITYRQIERKEYLKVAQKKEAYLFGSFLQKKLFLESVSSLQLLRVFRFVQQTPNRPLQKCRFWNYSIIRSVV